jgi:hypothetical protein
VAGITIGPAGVPLATAGPALAVVLPPTWPAVTGVITGPHTFVLKTGEVVVVGENLHPNALAYQASILVTAVTAVTTVKGVTAVTTGGTFRPLSRTGQVTTFTVVPRSGNRDCPSSGH